MLGEKKNPDLCLDAYNSKPVAQDYKTRICISHTIQEKKRGGQDRNTKDVKSKNTLYKERMGCRNNQLRT